MAKPTIVCERCHRELKPHNRSGTTPMTPSHNCPHKRPCWRGMSGGGSCQECAAARYREDFAKGQL